MARDWISDDTAHENTIDEKTVLLVSTVGETTVGDASQDNARREAQRQAKKTRYIVLVFSVILILRIVLAIELFGPWSGGPSTHHHDHHTNQALKLLKETPLIDGHNDFPISLRGKYNNKLYDNDFQERFENGGLFGEFDAPRLEKGKMGGAFWSVWAPCPANVTDFSDHNYEPSVRLTLEQIDLVQRLASLYPSYFTTTHSTHAAHAAFKSNDLISPLGIEGLHQIGNSASILRLYQSLGVRYATLTWNCHNRYADAAIITEHLNTTYVSKPLHHGLSAAGRDLVLEMNRIGMLVDISHVSTETMRSALIGNDSLTATDPVTGQQTPWKGSLAPPIFSHSSARAICPHPRNVADDVLLLVKKRNGIVMVNFNPDFISCSAPPADSVSGMPVFEKGNNTLAQVVRHIMHIGDLIGYEHVGLGSDFDGIEHVPEGLEDVSKYPDLVAELLRKGVSKKDVKGVVGENILRVWKEAEKVSEMLKSKGARMLEDNVYWPEK